MAHRVTHRSNAAYDVRVCEICRHRIPTSSRTCWLRKATSRTFIRRCGLAFTCSLRHKTHSSLVTVEHTNLTVGPSNKRGVRLSTLSTSPPAPRENLTPSTTSADSQGDLSEQAEAARYLGLEERMWARAITSGEIEGGCYFACLPCNNEPMTISPEVYLPTDRRLRTETKRDTWHR